MYVVWITDLEEYNMFAGVATTKKKAQSIAKRAFKFLKDRSCIPDEFSERQFEIEKIRDGQVSKFVYEYE